MYEGIAKSGSVLDKGFIEYMNQQLADIKHAINSYEQYSKDYVCPYCGGSGTRKVCNGKNYKTGEPSYVYLHCSCKDKGV